MSFREFIWRVASSKETMAPLPFDAVIALPDDRHMRMSEERLEQCRERLSWANEMLSQTQGWAVPDGFADIRQTAIDQLKRELGNLRGDVEAYERALVIDKARLEADSASAIRLCHLRAALLDVVEES